MYFWIEKNFFFHLGATINSVAVREYKYRLPLCLKISLGNKSPENRVILMKFAYIF